MAIQKMTEVPYPGVVPWLAVRKKINEIIDEGGGASVTVDDALSPTSENPVQNKVIYEALQNLPTGGGTIIIETDASWSDDPIDGATNITINGESATKEEAWDAICKNGLEVMQNLAIIWGGGTLVPKWVSPNSTYSEYTDVGFWCPQNFAASDIEGDREYSYMVQKQTDYYHPFYYNRNPRSFVKEVYSNEVAPGNYSQDDVLTSLDAYGTELMSVLQVNSEIYSLIGNGISVDTSGSTVKLVATGAITITESSWPALTILYSDYSGIERNVLVVKAGVTKL